MISRLRKIIRWPILTILGFLLMSLGNDGLRLDPAQQASGPFMYDVIKWELDNFFDKWVHRVIGVLGGSALSERERLNRVGEFFRIGEDVRKIEVKLSEAIVSGSYDASRYQDELTDLKQRREHIRNDVEEAIESAISDVISDEGIASWRKFTFPPVDVRLTELPKLLVTSPRERISRTHEVLLNPSVTAEDSEAIENQLSESSNLSAIVVSIGGLATYPASIPNNQPLCRTLQIASHEWLHHHFFFYPLGQNMFNDIEMQVLNETMANIAGNELGSMASDILLNKINLSSFASNPSMYTCRHEQEEFEEQVKVVGPEPFRFGQEMRNTRLKVDQLLSEGLIEQAEAYMENRRILFVKNGFNIRKLNQAYFAFNGTYADNPASVSPVGGQVLRFRRLMSSLGEFIHEIAIISNFKAFEAKLEAISLGSSVRFQ